MSDKARPDPADVADQIHSAAIHLLRHVARDDPKSGLSAARLSALSVIVFAGPLTLAELALAERVTPPTMTRIVQALERDALVRRQRATDDKRAFMVTATSKGRRRLQAARQRRVARLTAALDTLSGADLETLERASCTIEEIVSRSPSS